MLNLRSKALAIIIIIGLSSFTLTFSVISLPQHGEERYEGLSHEVMTKLSELRGLNPPEKFEVEIVSSSWYKEHYGKPTTVEEPLEWKIYRGLLLIPTEVSYEKFEEEWAGFIIAASSGETLYVVSDLTEKADEKTLKRILAHESMHILQYVNFKIVRSGIYDEEQALNALIEGDSDFSSDLFLKTEGYEPPLRDAFKPEKLSPNDALMMVKLFPYQYGESFITYLYEEGRWDLVNEAYRNLPSSTEQVIHPEKYLHSESYDEPSVLTPSGEWTLLGENRLGEYFIYVLLARWTGYDEAEAASNGWNGDKAAYYQNEGNFLLVWATLWDSEKDGEEFYQAIIRMLSNAGGVEISENLWKVENTYIGLRTSNISVEIYSSNNLEALK